MSAEDIGLHDELHQAELKLESNPDDSLDKSSSSETRDRLKEAEAAERRLRTVQVAQTSEPSEAVSGEQPASGSECTHRSASHSHSSGEPTSVDSSNFTIEELQDRVELLSSALAERDDQQALLLNRLAVMGDANNESLKALNAKLNASRMEQRAAETARDKLEVKSAGSRARQDSSISRLAHQTNEMMLELKEQKAALDKSESEVRTTRAKRKADEEHHRRVQDHDKDLHVQLRNTITSLSRELQLQKHADRNRASDSQEGDRDQQQEKKRLREELHELLASKQKDREQMATMRLEMLGLRRSQEFRQVAVDEDTSDTASGSQTLLPRSRKGKGKRSKLGKGQIGGSARTSKGRGGGKARGQGKPIPLHSIDEDDEDEDDLPSLQEAAWASECVSSDAGDSIDERSLDDISEHRRRWQSDLVGRIKLELDTERKARQALKDDIASLNAEHALETELMLKMAETQSKLHENIVEESQRIKNQSSTESIQNIRDIDKLQLTLRNMENHMDQQKARLVRQSIDEERQKADKEQLEEKLNMYTEQLRIAGLRLEDSKQQQMLDAAQQRREMTDLKKELAMERCQPRSGHDKEDDVKTPEKERDLRQMIRELQQDRNMLISKLEAREVHFRVQLEELEMQHNAKICELQNDFTRKLEDLRQDHHRSHWDSRQNPQAQGSRPVVGSLPSTADVSTPSQNSEGDTLELQAGLHSMVWSVISLIPNLAVLLCSLDGFVVRRISEKACALLETQLSGQMLFSFLREGSSATSLRCAILMNQSMAENSRTPTPGFAAHKLGRYELRTKYGRHVTAGISMAHLPAESSTGEGRSLLVFLAEDASSFLGGNCSAPTSEICPSDSVSVCPQRENKLTVERRKSLRASFFSSKKSAISSAFSADT
eukprot:TRINITY_DN8186_c0_g2_i1.p1 TRINITY_DN8186_c0_g2~~TRINITY_DN8186_c0_g2_i1.p1  ORF type:complete len:964 (+),score=204.99 TRINITY_DN8186_c0_g2_i1:217-2892(+)